MRRIVIIEDERLLLAGIVRGLKSSPELGVVAADNLDLGLRAIDEARPDLVLSDINLPDRSGLELLGELQKRKLVIPVIFMTAFMSQYRPFFRKHPYLEVVEKPISIAELRALILDRLERASRQADAPPFSLADYLQLACLGRHSVTVEVRHFGLAIGTLLVFQGELWSVQDKAGTGEAALQRLVALDQASSVCVGFHGGPPPRNITRSWEAVLLDAVRQVDEERAGKTDDTPEPLLEQDLLDDAAWEELARPPARASGLFVRDESSFEEVYDAALDALLDKSYETALDALLEAERIRPGDPRVSANLQRLKDLGVDGAEQALVGDREKQGA